MADAIQWPAAIQRTAEHTYIYGGKRYPGVTNILKVLDKSGPLMAWAARNTAEAALRLPIQEMRATVGDEGVIKALTSRSEWKRDEAAQLGTDVHKMADDMIQGRVPDNVLYGPGPVFERVRAYADWWKNSGWTLRASEAMVMHEVFGYGGTLDLLARDRDGRTVLADIKTGSKGVYREAILQLTAYGLAPLIQTDAGLFTQEEPERYAILHVTADGVREIPVEVGVLDKVAWGACMDLYQWTMARKATKL